MPGGAPSRRRAASATAAAAAAAASPTASPGPAVARSERDLLESILLKLPDPDRARSDALDASALDRETRRKEAHREREERRRLSKKSHLSEVGGALAIVAALVGGGLLEALLSPVWAQVQPDQYLGVCREWGYADSDDPGNCEMWRTVFGVASSLSFFLTMCTLLLTIGVVLGLNACLAWAIPTFVLSLDAMALALVSTAWLAFPAQAAYTATALMLALVLVSMVAFIPGLLIIWYSIFFRTVAAETVRETMEKNFNSSGSIFTESLLAFQLLKDGILLGELIDYAAYYARWHHRLLLRMLIVSGGDVDAPSHGGLTPIMVALAKDECKFAGRHWEAAGILVNEGGDFDHAATIYARYLAWLGDTLRTEKLLIKFPVALEGVNVDGWGALHFAAYAGHNEMIEFIAEDSPNLKDTPTNDGHTAFMIACRNGHFDAASAIHELFRCDAGAVDKNGQSVLMHAACSDSSALDAPFMKGLSMFKNINNVNAHDLNGATALMFAANAGNTFMLNEMLGTAFWSVDVNAVDNDGRSALMHAAIAGDADVVQALLKHNAAVNAVDDKSCSVFMHAARSCRHQEVMSALLAEGADINYVDSDGLTVLSRACVMEELDLVDWLLKACADVNCRRDSTGRRGEPVLVLAVRVSSGEIRFQMVRKLLDASADVNAADDKDGTALMFAAKEGDVRVATALLEKGANPHLADADGRTALHYAYTPKSSILPELLHGELTEASIIILQKWVDICDKDAVGTSLINEYGMNPMAQLLTNYHAREQNADAPSRSVNSHRTGIANAV